MSKYFQFKKYKKYYLDTPAEPAEYKRGNLIMIGDFDSLESCQTYIVPVVYWVTKDTDELVLTDKVGFSPSLVYSADGYNYYTIDGAGTDISFGTLTGSRPEVISGGTLDTSQLTDCSLMFSNCVSLKSLDLTSWNIGNISNKTNMFTNCSLLTEIKGLNKIVSSGTTDIPNMFSGCSSLATLDLSGWDTSNVIKMGSMFYRCTALETLDLSNFDTSNVTYMSYMFRGCSSLISLDLSGWNISDALSISDVFSMGYMFYECPALRTIYMRGCNSITISKIEDALTDAGIRDNVTIVTE